MFPATRPEALARLRHFVTHRLPTFGPYEDAMLAGAPLMVLGNYAMQRGWRPGAMADSTACTG